MAKRALQMIKDLEIEEFPVLSGRPSVITRIFVSEPRNRRVSQRRGDNRTEVEVIQDHELRNSGSL